MKIDMERMAEAGFCTGEKKFPHAAEPCVVNLFHFIAVIHEPAAPFLQCVGVVQTQRLHIGDVESGLFHMGYDFRQRRRIPTGENIFQCPGIRRSRTVGSADGMKQGNTVVGEMVPHGFEKYAVKRQTNVLNIPTETMRS